MKELRELIRYATSKGYKVSFVGKKVLHDYAGMNPEAAKIMHFHNIHPYELEILNTLPLGDQKNNLRHEIVERNLMHAGMAYFPAHLIALKLESVHLPLKSIDTLARLGQYEVVSVHKDGALTVKSGGKVCVIGKNGVKKESQEMKGHIRKPRGAELVMMEMVQGKKDLASFEAEAKAKGLRVVKEYDETIGNQKAYLAKAFKVPHVTLKPRSGVKLVKMHDDGDMTVKQGGRLHMVTPDRKVFRELPKKQAQATGLTSIKRGQIYHTPVKGGVLLSRRSLRRGRH
jgi:hypothetical protein